MIEGIFYARFLPQEGMKLNLLICFNRYFTFLCSLPLGPMTVC